jgi:hypothetical protein
MGQLPMARVFTIFTLRRKEKFGDLGRVTPWYAAK